MIDKINNLYDKYKKIIIIIFSLIILIITVLIIYLLTGKNINIKEYKNEKYLLKYDSSWKIDSAKNEKIVLKHKKGALLEIDILKLQEEYRYYQIEDIIDELIYDINLQNEGYNLIYSETAYVTKNCYDGYRTLFERENEQVMVVIAKKSDELIMFIYKAGNNNFDMLLDSVQNIVYHFDTIIEKYNLTNNLNIKTSKINYGESNTIDNKLSDSKEYEIAYKNYYVKYSIPSNFSLQSIDSTNGSFRFNDLKDNKISLNVNIYNYNIYEYFDKDKSVNIYKDYNLYKTSSDYSNQKENVAKISGKYEGFIYKFSCTYDKAISYENNEVKNTSELRDNVILVYALNRNHILVIKVESTKEYIPEKLIDMIKVNYVENYANYINSKKENGMIISDLKRLVGYDKKIEEITLKLPEKYVELDKGLNIYTDRVYGLNYNEELDLYDYDIEYSLTSEYLTLESQLKLINNTFKTAYGNYNKLSNSKKEIINGKEFLVYDGGYTDLLGIMFTSKDRVKTYVNVKILFYKLDSGGYLRIKINGNGKKINNNLLNEIVNFA